MEDTFHFVSEPIINWSLLLPQLIKAVRNTNKESKEKQYKIAPLF